MTNAQIAVPDSSTPADIVRWQNECLVNKRFEEIGTIWSIVFEAPKDGAVPEEFISRVYGVAMDFPVEQNLKIAQTLDKTTLLILGQFRKKDGHVGLWDIPDPRWKPPIPKPSEIADTVSKKGKVTQMAKPYVPPQCPKIAQELEKRARGVLRGTNYMVFGPVMQILVRPKGVAEGWILRCSADPAGRHMELLVDRKTGEAKFLFGQFSIDRAGTL